MDRTGKATRMLQVLDALSCANCDAAAARKNLDITNLHDHRVGDRSAVRPSRSHAERLRVMSLDARRSTRSWVGQPPGGTAGQSPPGLVAQRPARSQPATNCPAASIRNATNPLKITASLRAPCGGSGCGSFLLQRLAAQPSLQAGNQITRGRAFSRSGGSAHVWLFLLVTSYVRRATAPAPLMVK